MVAVLDLAVGTGGLIDQAAIRRSSISDCPWEQSVIVSGDTAGVRDVLVFHRRLQHHSL
jgi:hypothetical protein